MNGIRHLDRDSAAFGEIAGPHFLRIRTIMTNEPNYYDLSGHLTRIGWYPKGKGGPLMPGGASGNTPVLTYTNGSLEASVTGADLTVNRSPAGTFVTAVVKKTGIVPGGITSFAVLILMLIVGRALLFMQLAFLWCIEGLRSSVPDKSRRTQRSPFPARLRSSRYH